MIPGLHYYYLVETGHYTFIYMKTFTSLRNCPREILWPLTDNIFSVKTFDKNTPFDVKGENRVWITVPIQDSLMKIRVSKTLFVNLYKSRMVRNLFTWPDGSCC